MIFTSALTSLQPDSALSYAIAIIIPGLDAIFPVLPSETAVIALGVATAGSTDPRIALLILCAALGAFLGDNLCYLIGHRFGPRVERRFFSSARGARQRAWAEQSLDRYGTQLIIVCRFIPGGRTAVTLCCGLIGYPRRRFVPATAVAALAWAMYSFFIGRLGGRAFEDKPWAGLLLSLGITLVISALIEAFRRIRGWSRRRQAAAADARYPGPQQAEAQHGEPEDAAPEPEDAAPEPEDAAPEEDQAGRPPAGRAETGPCGVGRPDR
jgi:membrane-associated protein